MTERVNFGKLKEVLAVPDLVAIQLDSYRSFIQADVPPAERANIGLQEVFNEVFPILSFDREMELEFVSYTVGDTKGPPIESLKDGGSFSAPLHVDFILKNKNQKVKERVYMGDLPIMTERGTFVINGAERVIISQLHRTPGICFEKSRHTSGKGLYSYRVIPDRGSWMDVQFDINDYIYIFVDKRSRRRKFLISTFLRAMGYESNREILAALHEVKTHTIGNLLKFDNLNCYYTIGDVAGESGEIIIEELTPLAEPHLIKLREAGVKSLELVHIPDGDNYMIKCMKRDPSRTQEEALKEIYRRMRPGDPPTLANSKQLIQRMFLDQKRYDLGAVGRFKINEKLGVDMPLTQRSLTKEDLLHATSELMRLRNVAGPVDDIDHLGSRRIRTVGELLQNQCRVGLARTERMVRERMILLGSEDAGITPGKLINPKAFSGVVRDFFARNQLSQFMDQTNPLSELANKRRLSALGPGGLTRDRAGFEVRDVHSSHYGLVCPIETPEGPNIGLISSLALYAKVNKYGFLETPYRRVKNGVVSDQVDYLSADKEEDFVIAQANAPLDANGRFERNTVMCRHIGDSKEMASSEVHYMDVSPKQLVSAATGLIPFLEHDDANRALMGSNMQRQAVPLLVTDSPLVGTGLEARVASDSRSVLRASGDGIVAAVSADTIVVTGDGNLPGKAGKGKDPVTYELIKFLRSNAGTSINQRPLVKTGDRVVKGQVIADGAATQGGELALGKNVMVAFMPWCGYNFEDAIVISERLVKDDVFTSVHIEEFEITARDTKLGPEEITRDIPNESEEALHNLGVNGVVRLGAEVKPGDIIVGKITPKSETELAPEERLLRAIFGDKAADVKNSSLVVSSGKGGIVMDVRVEYARDINRQSMTKAEVRRQTRYAKDTFKQQHSDLVAELAERLADLMLGQKLPHPIYDDSSSKDDSVLISPNRKVTESHLAKLANKFDCYRMEDCPLRRSVDELVNSFKPRFKEIEEVRDTSVKGIEDGDTATPGVIKKVKVYVASKRKIEVGDKVAGRHGNKGIVAKIVPVEDLPYLADGTPVDIVLNPLGVPSRMNVGQVLETHLGWAAQLLGMKIASPVFDGINENEIIDLMNKANAKVVDGERYKWGFVNKGGKWVYDGKTELYDGRSGEKFAQRVCVGAIYMLKLDHLVANKIHSRSVGSYSLVTQQPLGGKAQHGGQRFGEMEVWALEAYGAAHTLQEMLTVKSDDVAGRTLIYESIVRGQNILEAGRPESFNVLMKEMQSLGLNIRTVKQSHQK